MHIYNNAVPQPYVEPIVVVVVIIIIIYLCALHYSPNTIRVIKSGLPSQKPHLTRRRIFLPANWT
jgi:hypothetical protein